MNPLNLEIQDIITTATWDDPLNNNDPNDPFYGLPFGDSQKVTDIMLGSNLIATSDTQ